MSSPAILLVCLAPANPLIPCILCALSIAYRLLIPLSYYIPGNVIIYIAYAILIEFMVL